MQQCTLNSICGVRWWYLSIKWDVFFMSLTGMTLLPFTKLLTQWQPRQCDRHISVVEWEIDHYMPHQLCLSSFHWKWTSMVFLSFHQYLDGPYIKIMAIVMAWDRGIEFSERVASSSFSPAVVVQEQTVPREILIDQRPIFLFNLCRATWKRGKCLTCLGQKPPKVFWA